MRNRAHFRGIPSCLSYKVGDASARFVAYNEVRRKEMESGQLANRLPVFPNLTDSVASLCPEVPIVLVNELYGIELLACYSDGGANQLA